MKLYLESYGCTLQKSEASLYVNRLISEGNTLVKTPEEADLSILGTCVVIRKTEDRMVRRIEKLSNISKVRVIGCLSSTGGDLIKGSNVEVVDSKEFRSFYNGVLDDVEVREPSIWEGIPINQGCTGSCNFCISKIARGKLVSRPEQKIVRQVEMQLARGIREIKITSLDTASYGPDIDSSLDSLLNEIEKIREDFRLRIGMMEPANASRIVEGLLEKMQDERIYKFLHIPVQSGDDSVLREMNRGYSVRTFTDLVKRIRTVFEDSTLSTDIVVGYHNDDEDSFERTFSLMEDIKPDIMNITRFSPRPFTKDYNRKVPPSNHSKRWSAELTSLHKEILSKKLSSTVGALKNAMSTEYGKNETTVLRDNSYRPIVIKNRIPLYEMRDVEIVDHSSTFLIGKVL